MNVDTLLKGEKRHYSVTFEIDQEITATVSSVEWEVCGSTVTISNETLLVNVASSDITASAKGVSTVKITATLSDGQKSIGFIKINVQDPM